MSHAATGMALPSPKSGLWSLLAALLLAFCPLAARAQAPNPVVCTGNAQLPQQGLLPGGAPQPDLLVTGKCTVGKGGAYYYGDVFVLSGGTLDFEQPPSPFNPNPPPNTTPGAPDIDFWASSIVVEANGALEAGVIAPYGAPRLGDNVGGYLTIYIYGKNQSVDANGNPVDPAATPGQGVVCKPNTGAGLGPCGIPSQVWANNGSSVLPGCGAAATTEDSKCIPGLPTAASDYFYQYGPLYGDSKCANGATFSVSNGKALCGSAAADGLVGYFGYKVLAVSYGGSLILNGYKGVATGLDNLPLQSGNSWLRLNGDLNPGTSTLVVDGSPAQRWWLPSDADPSRPHPLQIVVTTTDYVPDHSEELTVTQVQGDKVTLASPLKWFHSGIRYAIGSKITDPNAKQNLINHGMDSSLVNGGAETRAAVALLTRNIRIVSGGDVAGQTFDQAVAKAQAAGKTYYFGAHTVFRQGFRQIQVDGVEFAELGQGGKKGHYPIHFHKTRQVPPATFVNDSSVNDSNTRWYVLHDTQGVTFQRDVGWKSIGHGYHLEDGTETDNNLYSDLGIMARAAIPNADNPRLAPGILADNGANAATSSFPYRSDNEHPTVFWITNGWNNLEGDMAAGAGACGAGFWFVPMANSDVADVPTTANNINGHMKWDDGTGVFGFAGLQRGENGFSGASPLKDFSHNYSTSAYFAFQTTPDSPACLGFLANKAPALNTPTVREIASFAPPPAVDLAQDTYYPRSTGARKATACPLASTQVPGLPPRYNCSLPPIGKVASPCAFGAGFQPGDPNSPEYWCTVTVLDHFTASFTWPEGNYAGIWLRPQWYLVDNNVITDPQNAGFSFISGGDFTRSSLIEGDWALLENSVLVGHTQPQDQAHRYTLDTGPFNSFTAADNFTCAALVPPGNTVPNYCLNAGAGISMVTSSYFSNQRLFSIYDGPAYEAANAYLDTTTAPCALDGYNGKGGCMYGTGMVKNIFKNQPGVANSPCYLPNAAIAWKQPNGFFYPPSFHSNHLYFGNVEIRHFVIDPLFKAFSGSTPGGGDFGQGGTYITDPTAVSNIYCLTATNDPKTYFNSFTGIDRQTELNDDDGTLTGLSNNIQPGLTPPNPLKQTISVNEDDFFTAPVETPECATNIGVNVTPAHACDPPSRAAPTITAKTSPYDYVATVIYHTPDSLGTGGTWSSTCSNPTCYGVPLYRQYLAGVNGGSAANSTREWKHWYANGCDKNISTPQCRWPYIRMAGENIATRETLTVNNGVYYLDTAVPLTMQQNEAYNAENGGSSQNLWFNAFMPGNTYTVFFVFAKDTTRQTYQIYLGTSATASNIQAVRVKLDTAQFPSSPVTPAPAWLTVDTSKVASNGIVSVTVDLTKVTDGSLDPVAANGLCQPRQFCAPTGANNACVSTLPAGDPRKTDYDAVCGEWAVKDLDCPHSGCYGFTFTIPGTGFAANATTSSPTPRRLQPTAFPTNATGQGQPTWLVKFLGTTLPPDNTANSQCHYPTLPTYPPPGMGECDVPDWVPQ